MARLNAKRRRELAARRALTEFAKVVNPTSQAKSGFVRNTHKAHVLNQIVPEVARANTPKPPLWEGNGKAGRVSRGKLVPPKKPDRWS